MTAPSTKIMDIVDEYGNAEHRQDDGQALYFRNLLADQVEALTKERDATLEQNTRLDAACAQMEAERDALMAAAKLALDALRHSASVCGNSWGGDQCRAAIDLLEKAGVK